MVLAMLKLHRSDRLKSLGWRQLLQIHDELIFEGALYSHQRIIKVFFDIFFL